MKTLMITGASGFLGAKVTERFTGKYNVVAVTSGRAKIHFSKDVTHKTVNLLTEADRLIEDIRPDVVLHLAWGKQDGAARNSDDNIAWLEASLKMLRSFVNCGGKRFVFAGTSSEYEFNSGLFQENYRDAQMSMYGETKKAFSEIANNYCRRAGVSFVDIRLFTLYGENDQHVFGAIPMCINSLLRGETFTCKAPNAVRDYVYVGDAALAVEKITDSDWSGTINVSSGQPRSMREVFTFIARELAKEELLLFENEDKCSVVLVGDNSLLVNEIGFERFTQFEEGMKKTVLWWKNHFEA